MERCDSISDLVIWMYACTYIYIYIYIYMCTWIYIKYYHHVGAKVVRKAYASSKTSIFEEFEIIFLSVLYETSATIIFQLIIIKRSLLIQKQLLIKLYSQDTVSYWGLLRLRIKDLKNLKVILIESHVVSYRSNKCIRPLIIKWRMDYTMKLYEKGTVTKQCSP